MIAVRLREGAFVAGLVPGSDGLLPVVGARPAYTAAEAELDGYLVGPTDADRELAALRRLRRESLFVGIAEDAWRAFLRESSRFSVYAELEEWAEPPRRRQPAQTVTLAEAEWLIEEGYADPVEPDLAELEAELARWAGET